jgi:hypothetical protein
LFLSSSGISLPYRGFTGKDLLPDRRIKSSDFSHTALGTLRLGLVIGGDAGKLSEKIERLFVRLRRSVRKLDMRNFVAPS